MLISATPRLPADSLVIQVHVPRTSGTSVRLLFNQVFGDARCLMNYNGELDDAKSSALEPFRFVSGHVGYGAYRDFSQEAYYLAILRNPIDRYLSTYAEFLTNAESKHHAAAQRYDVNAFLRHTLETDDASLWQQLHNLQCRLICGEASYRTAREYVDTRYYLVAPFPETDAMTRLLGAALGTSGLTLPRTHETWRRMPAHDGLPTLTDASVALLLESESEDMLLYSYVQKAFAQVRDALLPGPAPHAGARLVQPAPCIPPKELRFMGESDEVFLRHADHLAANVLRHCVQGGQPASILDIGCGYGRLAYGLKRAGFEGQYQGFDILRRHIAWLNENFRTHPADDHYSFLYADVYNERYNPEGQPLDELTLPYPPATFDCLASLSVFTHMYEEEVVKYIRYFKNLLKDGGIWVMTCFALPPEFALDKQPGNATYSLAQQISANAFIHSREEPLLVIAFREQFLLDLFAREGLDVISQKKGRWFTQDNAQELQDWFVLRRRDWRAAMQPPALLRSTGGEMGTPAAALPARPVCDICGGKEFAPGPSGRLAASGLAPRCLQCGSLERHRVLRRVFQALPLGFLNWRHGLQFGTDPGIAPHWFKHHEISAAGDAGGLDIQAIARADGSCDFISLVHVLESVPDDIAAFGELCRVLSPRGLLQICFGGTEDREHTIDLDQPMSEWRTRHLYGRDVRQRFDCEERGLTMLVVEESDVCTGMREIIHLFLKCPDDAMRVKAWLSSWSTTLRLLP